jgi:hypothetical protein
MTYDEFIAQAPRYVPGKGIEPDAELERNPDFQAGLKALAQKIDDEIVADLLAQAKEAERYEPESVVEADGYAGA